MQAVILAAGESSRFWPFNYQHKSLFKIMGRSLIWYTIENLRKNGIKDVIVVQGVKRDVERELKKYQTKAKIRYVIQSKPKGTGNAIYQAKKLIKENFIVLGPHKIDLDSYLPLLLKKFKKNPHKVILLGVKTTQPWDFGILKFKKRKVLKIEENPSKGREPSDIKATETYIFPRNFFDYYQRVQKREESLIDAINLLIKEKGIELVLLKEEATSLKYPWELLNANEYLLKKIKTELKGKIEKNCKISGPSVIRKESLLKSGTYIKGPVYIGKNCQIGPNCYIRGFTSIGDNCQIGNGVEIKNSIIGNNTDVSHLSYIGDSVIGENCNLGAGTITANFRFDKKSITSTVKKKLIDTKKRKFGCVLGNNTKTGINVSLMPGVLIGSNCIIGPGSLVMENVEDNTIFYTKFKGIKKQI
ncbi:MAG: bifunctional sugar-1-phosphate nucleotidylyltransferase/acetyltransferase [Candidatus Nealsonbacteria bacterium]